MSTERQTKRSLEWTPGELIQGCDPRPDLAVKNWYGMDDRASYIANINKSMDPYYRGMEIEYVFNRQGYRSPREVSEYTENYFISFGCSETFGVGNRREDLWCTLLEKATGVENLNLGVQSTGLGFHVHNTMMYLEKYEQRPEFVVYQHPEVNRRLFVTNKHGFIRMETDTDFTWDTLQDPNNEHMITDYVRSASYAMILDRLWQAEGVKVYHFSMGSPGCTPYYDIPMYEILDLARDCSHGGYRTNKAIAQALAHQIQGHAAKPLEEQPLTEEELLKQRMEELRKRDPFIYR